MVKPDSLELYIIRHAETDYNDRGDRDGCDGDLTKRGEEQCIALGEKFKDIDIDAYITSPMLRAFKTAMGVLNAKPEKTLLQIMPEITECGVPVDYYGCSEEYLQKYYKNTEMCESLFGTEKFKTKYPCDNELRAKKVIDYIKSRYAYGNRVLLFTHQGFSQYLLRSALGIEKQTFDFYLNNTAFVKIEFTRGGAVILHKLG